MNVILLILWIFWACCWMALLGLGALALMGVIKLYDFLRGLYIARRNERQVYAEKWLRIGLKSCERRGWLPEDLQ